jgi:hypothetical protein
MTNLCRGSGGCRGSDPTEEYPLLWQSVWEYEQDYAPVDDHYLAQTCASK